MHKGIIKKALQKYYLGVELSMFLYAIIIIIYFILNLFRLDSAGGFAWVASMETIKGFLSFIYQQN